MSYNLQRRVCIVGVGISPIGRVDKNPEILNWTERELVSYAAMEAMEDAGIEAKDIDELYLGQVAPSLWNGALGGAAQVVDWLGMRNKPGVSHDEACATTSIGLQMAVRAVASGQADTVISAGVNINRTKVRMGMPPHLRQPNDNMMTEMNQIGNDEAYLYQGTGFLQPLEAAGISYCKKYGLTLQDFENTMNAAALNSRRNAVKNDKALFATETYEEMAIRLNMSLEDMFASEETNPFVGASQRKFHMCPVSDGASAVIVCTVEKAKQLKKTPIEILGMGAATVFINHMMNGPLDQEIELFKKIYRQAGIVDPYKEIEYLGMHDCSAQNYMFVTEGTGYFREGEAWKAIQDGRIAFDGDKPINTSGGRLNVGHPLGPAAGLEIAEAVKQMRGEAGDRQMSKIPRTSVVQGYGGGFHLSGTVLRRLED